MLAKKRGASVFAVGVDAPRFTSSVGNKKGFRVNLAELGDIQSERLGAYDVIYAWRLIIAERLGLKLYTKKHSHVGCNIEMPTPVSFEKSNIVLIFCEDFPTREGRRLGRRTGMTSSRKNGRDGGRRVGPHDSHPRPITKGPGGRQVFVHSDRFEGLHSWRLGTPWPGCGCRNN